MASKCGICKTEKSKHWLCCLGGWTMCDNCAKDFSDFENQVDKRSNIVILMEVYFRKGQGENISYEEMHKEKSHFNFLEFKDLFKIGIAKVEKAE